MPLTDTIKQLFEDYPRHATRRLDLPELSDALALVQAQPGESLAEQAYNLLNPGAFKPHCETCLKPGGLFKTFTTGYKSFCSARCAANSSAVSLKKAATNQKLYGAANPWQSTNAKQAYKSKMLERYGVEHAFQAESIKEAVKQTVRKKYGVEHAFQAEQVKELARTSKLETYAGEAWNKRLEVIKEQQGFELLSFEAHEPHKEFAWKHSCGHVQLSQVTSGRIYSCTKCKVCYTSKGEDAVAAYMQPFTEVLRNVRTIIKGFELDIYCPTLKLAIEFNGLYWHSDEWKTADYHLAKTQACEALGIKLIHIFEDEWLDKPEIVKSRLLVAAGKAKRIFARKCILKPVPVSAAFAFQRESHLQGPVGSQVRLGLYEHDILVALMTFGTPRFNKAFDWELLRYCTAPGITVVGGASKLLKTFKAEHPGKLISYADRRWSTGHLYRMLGMTEGEPSPPSFYYIKHGARHNRMTMQKHKLLDLLGDKFDSTASASENLASAGYRKIYDCGSRVFTA
jgi:hypothetical protein